MNPGLIILSFVVAGAATLMLGFVLRGVDRKVTARVQYRVGPPIIQPAIDVLKLMAKETTMPASARGTFFLLAPVIGLAATALAAAMLWMALLGSALGWKGEGADFGGDLIVVIYLLVVPALMTVMGALASGSPHAAVGAAREVKLLLSYELPLFLAILVPVSQAEWTFKLTAIQQAPTALYGISGVIAFVAAILCMQAKLGQIPFDMAEAECEIMSGVYVEYSGPALATFLMTRAMLTAVMPLLLVMLFWGGLTASVGGVLAFLGKYLLLVVLVTLIRNTNPRLRIDQTVRFFWFRLAPATIVAVALSLVGLSKGLSWL